MGNVRQSGANAVAVTFINPTAATITPTASEVYKIVSLRGITPATALALAGGGRVAQHLSVEQQFTHHHAHSAAMDLIAGQLVPQVSKPTQQTGLDIVGVRIVSNNVVGITFANVTAATITPTAAETYSIWALGGLDAFSNFLGFQFKRRDHRRHRRRLPADRGSDHRDRRSRLRHRGRGGLLGRGGSGRHRDQLGVPGFHASGRQHTITLMEFCGIGTGATPTASSALQSGGVPTEPGRPAAALSPVSAPVSVAANTSPSRPSGHGPNQRNAVVWVNKPCNQSGLGIAGVRVSAPRTRWRSTT